MTIRNPIVDDLRKDKDALVAELLTAGSKAKGKMLSCPFHDDTHPSGNIYADEAGVWRFKCHAGSCGWSGDIADVRAKATSRPIEEVLAELGGRQAPRPQAMADPPPKVYADVDAIRASYRPGQVEGFYVYTDPQTRQVDLVVVRYRPPGAPRKQFCPYYPHAGGFVKGGGPTPRPIYNRTRVRAARTVVFVEGEKCVHALADIGIVATTTPGGADAPEKADLRPLAGKTIYLWPDNDDAGRQYIRKIQKRLEGLEPRCRLLVVNPAPLGLPVKGDVADLLARYADPDAGREAVRQVLQSAQGTGADEDLRRRLVEIREGRYVALPWPWRRLHNLTKALLPGTVTLLCGSPGAAKSFMVLEAAAWWHEQGIPIALYELEDDRTYHIQRVFAQREGRSEFTDPDWLRIEANADAADARWAIHAAFLNAFGTTITASPDKAPTLTQLAEWVEAQAHAGKQIIIIDPVTGGEVEGKQWDADKAFMGRCKAALTRTGARLVLVTHPKLGTKQAGLDALAGGAAYGRFSQTVLWLVGHDPAQAVTVKTAMGTTGYESNATVRVVKARNGKGGGAKLAFTFDKQTLQFLEHGVIEND